MQRVPPLHIPVAGFPTEYPEPRYVKISCPICGSKNLRLIENWHMAIEWAVTEGWMDKAAGNKVDGEA